MKILQEDREEEKERERNGKWLFYFGGFLLHLILDI